MDAEEDETLKTWRFPLLVTGFMLLSQAGPILHPIRDAATLLPAPRFQIELPFSHLVLTPFCSLADFLTVLGLKQLGAAVAYALIGILLMNGIIPKIVGISSLIAFLAWGALMPRPMAKLVAREPDVAFVDFHSHTRFSHDGRPSFTPQANRRWHWRQGYHAGFITDHNRIEGARDGKAASREDWQKTGYRSLMGEEVSLYRTHLVVLGAQDRIDNQPYDSDPKKVERFIKDMRRKGLPVIASLPEYWLYHWPDGIRQFVSWGISGFEIINSAPKALDFPLFKRMEIVNLCRDNNLFMTGISDNHGYGQATAAWSAMRIPGWQKMNPDDLESAILASLKTQKYAAVQVLERTKHSSDSPTTLIFDPLMNGIVYWKTLQPAQAAVWGFWIGIFWGIQWGFKQWAKR